MASSSVGDNQLQRIIRDLQDAVSELSKEHSECGEPITDDSPSLHKFFYKLEYLLQFDQKERSSFLGQRKDYWDYFCDCLIKMKGANDGIRFVKSIPELKTSLGKGRAFVRYCLVHQRLADTLQQCLINHKVTSDWYYARSPLLKSHLTADIINHLYELNQIHFDVAARGYDLDSDWPRFARRTIGSSVAYSWRPPSRCSSVNSLVSSQAQEFAAIPDLSHSYLGELGELGEPSPCSLAENLRFELDQSELRQQELLVQVRELGSEASDLKGVIKDLKVQLSANQNSSTENTNLQENSELRDRLGLAENRNMELLTKLDEALKEKGQQTASFCDSAWKIQELLDKVKMAEEERLAAKIESEERTRNYEQLSKELILKEEELRNCKEELAQVKAKADSEHDQALKRLEELQGAVGRIQGALTLKEKETGNLRAQLQDLQSSLESRERQADDLRRRLEEEQEEVEHRCCSVSQNDDLEFEVLDLKKTLKNREKELAVSSERIKHLEEQLEKLNVDKEMATYGESIEDYKSQCSNLTEINAKLLLTVQKSDDSIKEISECKVALLEQLSLLRASERHLNARLDASNLSVEDREKKLLDENLYLEEIVQKILTQKDELDAQSKRLERENGQLTESKALLVKELAIMRDERDLVAARETMLERNVSFSQKSYVDLTEKLKETENKLKEQNVQGGILQARVVELENRVAELHNEKGAAESNENVQKVQSEETKDDPFRLVIAETQLEMNLKEVHRLQEEVVSLRAQLQTGTEEKLKAQALQEVTEASREDLRVLSEQLKGQVEELNRRHVDEILRSREREEALMKERDGEAQGRVGLASEVTAAREEINKQKKKYEALCVEHDDTRDALHRANTETAELGVRVCRLTAENEEGRLRWDELSSRLQEVEVEGERMNSTVERLRSENRELLQRLQTEGGQQQLQEERLTQVQQETQAMCAAREEEVQTLRFQMSSQKISHASQLQMVTEELEEVKSRLESEHERVVELENKLQELETHSQRQSRQIGEKNAQMVQSQTLVQEKENELIRMKGDLSRSEKALAAAEDACEELSENLRRLALDKKSVDLKTAAELDDLHRTKINLEERLIELIREKDALWQKTDALEFEQKLRGEDTERDVNQCLSCHSPFSFFLRKHTCRLCGRPFCYYCCSKTVTTQPGGSKERCCPDCYNQHSAVAERHPQEEAANSSSRAPVTPSRQLQAGRAASGLTAEAGDKQDDGVFDIITDEEVSGVYDSDSFNTACSPTREQQGAPQLSSASVGELTSEDTEDLSVTVQDAEIALLKSGELTLSVPFAADDISGFGDGFRELFIKSSCYSVIPISVSGAGPTVAWTFTSEPKSISFSVVYRESTHTPLEQARVLIPLTRCNSHKETIQGELKVRHPGEYMLIFDNSFSRFISKKVLYHLSLDKPVVYGGDDLL